MGRGCRQAPAGMRIWFLETVLFGAMSYWSAFARYTEMIWPLWAWLRPERILRRRAGNAYGGSQLEELNTCSLLDKVLVEFAIPFQSQNAGIIPVNRFDHVKKHEPMIPSPWREIRRLDVEVNRMMLAVRGAFTIRKPGKSFVYTIGCEEGHTVEEFLHRGELAAKRIHILHHPEAPAVPAIPNNLRGYGKRDKEDLILVPIRGFTAVGQVG